MSKSNISNQMKDLQNKYSKPSSPSTIPVAEEKKTNLIAQMNIYSDDKVENSIIELEEIYDSQIKRLNNLKEEDPELCIEKCNKFLDENNDKITKQLSTVIDLDKNIKKVVDECDKLELQEEKLNMMIKEPKYVELADTIKKVRGTIDSLNHFLVRKKISNYKK